VPKYNQKGLNCADFDVIFVHNNSQLFQGKQLQHKTQFAQNLHVGLTSPQLKILEAESNN